MSPNVFSYQKDILFSNQGNISCFLGTSSYYFYGNLFKKGKHLTSLKCEDCDSNVYKLYKDR